MIKEFFLNLNDTNATIVRHDLRIAVVIDDFSYAGFAPDCHLLALTAKDWQRQVITFRPHILLVESAWWGADKSWHRKISEAAPELHELITWCKRNYIPTVFWNKEDPVHFERFLVTASLFDVVFTTDMACIPKYKQALAHERVHVLPFACQPAVHNPLQEYERLPAACFAGSYYLRYPHRMLDLRSVLDAVNGLMPVDIYDRYFQSSDINYRFPQEYSALVKGTLCVDEMHRAYKGYRYGINMNTVKHSATMFSRRVFELLGSGTVVLSNESVGVRGFFGDIVLCSDVVPDMIQRLTPLLHDKVLRARQALLGVRAVMRQHTYAHRLDAITQRVLGRVGFLTPLPPVLLMAYAETITQVQSLLLCASQQSHTDWRMVLAVPDAAYGEINQCMQDTRVTVMPWTALQDLTLADIAQDLPWPAQIDISLLWIGGWLAQDHYGPHYLLDLVLATRYTHARILGKAGHFFWTGHSLRLVEIDQVYRTISALAARCALVGYAILSHEPVQAWLLGLAERFYENEEAVALDVFNYCRDGAANKVVTLVVDDAPMDMGLDLELLMTEADTMRAPPILPSSVPGWSAIQLAKAFGNWPSHATKATLDNYGWHLVSELPDDQEEEVWSPCILSAAQLRAVGVWRFHPVVTGGLRLRLMVQCIGVNDESLLIKVFECNQNQQLILPFGTRSLRLGWHITSSGTARVKELVLGWRTQVE